MKKSKKLMLGTIAAMGALAIGAGAVSTFAWYESSMAATANKGSLDQTITAIKGEADGENVYINVTITTTTAPELSRASDGKTYYKVGDNLYENSDAVTVGVYSLTVAWATGDQAKWADAGVAGHLDLTVTAVAPVTNQVSAELLSTSATTTVTANVVASHTMRVNIAADGALSFDTSSNYTNCTPAAAAVAGKFAVRPGYTTAANADSSSNLNYTTLLAVA